MAKKIALDLEIKSTSVGEATKKTTSLRTEIRNLRDQMASGELKGEAFTEAAKRAAAMQDQMDKVNKTVKTLANDNKRLDAFVSTAQGIAGGFAAAQGAAALFGSENEDLQKTMVKLQASMTLLNGLQQVSNLLRKESALNTVLLGKANVTATATTAGLTKGMKSLRAAIISTGIGALVVSLGLLIAYWDDIKGAINGVSGSQKDLNKLAEENLDIAREKSEQLSQQDNILKLQGKTEKEILLLKQAAKKVEIEAALNAIRQAQNTKKAQLDAAKRNQEILKGVMMFISLPLTAILKTIDEISKFVGKESNLLDQYTTWGAGFIVDPEKVAKEGEDVIKEKENLLAQLENQEAGYQLSLNKIQKDGDDNRKKQGSDAAKKAAAAQAVDTERRLMLIQDEEQRQLALLQNKHTIQQEEAKKNGQALLTLLALQSQEETALRDKFEQQRKDKKAADDAKEIADKAKSDKAALEASIISENDNFLKNLENRQKLLDLEREQALSNKELTAGELLKIEAQYTASSNALSKERTDKEKEDEEAKNNAILSAKQAFTNQSISILASLSNLARDNSKTQKALALTAIGVDTGAAISAAVRNSQANPANAVTGGVAGAVQFATSLAQILSGAAQAKRVLQGGQVRGAGASAGSARTTTELQPPTQINRDIQVQDRGGNGQRVFVLENDITTTQDRVGRIRANSVID